MTIDEAIESTLRALEKELTPKSPRAKGSPTMETKNHMALMTRYFEEGMIELTVEQADRRGQIYGIRVNGDLIELFKVDSTLSREEALTRAYKKFFWLSKRSMIEGGNLERNH